LNFEFSAFIFTASQQLDKKKHRKEQKCKKGVDKTSELNQPEGFEPDFFNFESSSFSYFLASSSLAEETEFGCKSAFPMGQPSGGAGEERSLSFSFAFIASSAEELSELDLVELRLSVLESVPEESRQFLLFFELSLFFAELLIPTRVKGKQERATPLTERDAERNAGRVHEVGHRCSLVSFFKKGS